MSVSDRSEQKTPNGDLEPVAQIKHDLLVKGLELMSEYYSAGWNKIPELRSIEFYMQILRQLQDLETEATKTYRLWKHLEKRDEIWNELKRDIQFVENILHSHTYQSHHLLQILLEIQNEFHWLPNHLLLWVSWQLQVSMAQILHIATFYKVFSLEPKGKHIVRVCLGTACHVRGGALILASVERVLKTTAGSTTSDGLFTLERVNCLGCCALGPVMVVDNDYHGKLDPTKLKKILEVYR